MGIFDRWKSAKQRLAPGQDDPRAEEARANGLVDEGNALCDKGRLQEAIERYTAALRLAPRLARAHLNLGNALLDLGQVTAALEAYARALAEKPDYAPAHYNMGNADARLGRTAQAMAHYREAVTLDPQFADAWVALGNIQDDMRLADDAVASYRRALLLQPAYAPVHANLGNILRQVGRLEEAVECYRRALDLDPGLGQAHLGWGLVLLDQGAPVDALARFRRAVDAREPSGAALAQAYHCANQLCEWGDRAQLELELTDAVARGARGVPPFYLLGLDPPSGGAASLQRQAARQFAEATLGGTLAGAAPATARARAPQDRLHVGYLSADFHDHATMHLLRGVLAAHDRSAFRITAYSYGSVEDDVTAQVRETTEGFRDLKALSDAQAAELVSADGVDILVDLKGFTRHARLGIGASRPAPVLVSWLGYPGTLGAPGLADYLVGDAIVTPPQYASSFSETLALMPHCYQPNDAQRPVGPRPTRAEAGLPKEAFVFCSFNQGYKLNPASFDVWCRLLAEVPGSVLWLLPGSAPMVANLRREAADRGVDPDRLVFCQTLPPAEHLARLALADLALDTFPYNSHTTGSDALWAGVPLVTRMGETFASRVAASLLHAAGLAELVTSDWDGYFSLAKALALDAPRLAELRRRLSERPAELPLFDTARFTRDLERLYRRIWEQHLSAARETIVLPDEFRA